MKYLIYTVSDFTDCAEECISILYDSILKQNTKSDFDFVVVTNKSTQSKFNLLIDDSMESNYVGWLKYTNKLPEGYDGYLYLDSDIIFYEKIKNMFGSHPISVIYENHPMSSSWFMFDMATNQEKQEMININGCNAGTFSFTNKTTLEEINSICKLVNIENLNKEDQAKIEQTCFNYFIFKLHRQQILINDITPFIQLHVQEKQKNKSIFHFCGFDGSMINKYKRMKEFIETNVTDDQK
jgi:hypothetical protein